ncbi:hypothetical protein [Terrihabitans sp. B22-R8]|uniref:type III secretion apparatus assembly protein SctX n=1 Tax=Terrihabitans sp. B22-R8 TaxID=3425128 RepID=UPI00403CCFC0
MVKLPRRPIRPDVPLPAVRDEPSVHMDKNPGRIDRPVPGIADAGGQRARKSADQPPQAPGDLPLDLAIEAVLETPGLDGVTRISLDDMRTNLVQVDPRAMLASLYGRNLAHALLNFVMPKLRHPDVLQAGAHAALLERLAERLAGAENDGVRQRGAAIVDEELQRLVLLRQNRNSMIEG